MLLQYLPGSIVIVVQFIGPVGSTSSNGAQFMVKKILQSIYINFNFIFNYIILYDFKPLIKLGLVMLFVPLSRFSIGY